ncbi:MAG: hypothetical protein SGCHY_004538 [Lobulomycetales sp.]
MSDKLTIFEPLEVIGRGSFGVIRKVRRKSDGKLLARKEIDYRKMNEREKRQLVAEVNILRELDHPHIVKYYERFVDKPTGVIFILMEYCCGGDLSHVIKRYLKLPLTSSSSRYSCRKERKFIPESVIWSFLTVLALHPHLIASQQLLLALNECHDKAIVHRDLKPSNIFLDKDQNLKIGDFGLSKTCDSPDTLCQTFVGTPYYMSPELINESSYNAKSDIWSLGCLIYELATLEPPFQSKTQAGLSQKIRQGKLANLPPHFSSELARTIGKMLAPRHEQRPGTLELLKLGRIPLMLAERRVNEQTADLERRLALLRVKEKDLEAREAAISRREALLLAKHPERVELDNSKKAAKSDPDRKGALMETTRQNDKENK